MVQRQLSLSYQSGFDLITTDEGFKNSKFKPQKPEAISAFRERSAETGIGPAFLHGSYLVNLGGDAELLEKSIGSLTDHMGAAAELGAQGVIFHSGSNKGKGFDAVLDQAVAAITQVLANTSEETWLIIENSAGAGNHIGATFEEIGRMIDAIDPKDSGRVRVCIDTQHTLAAGYDITTSAGLDAAMSEFDAAIGLDRLAAVHANDSKTELGSGKDRHENIGHGAIGEDGFANIMAHPAFADVPFLLEVPGMEGNGPDVPNIDALKAIRERVSG